MINQLREHLAAYPLGAAGLIFANEVGGALRRSTLLELYTRRTDDADRILQALADDEGDDDPDGTPAGVR